MNTMNVAVFVDFENVAIGAREAGLKDVDMSLVLARLLEKGNVIYKRAYADWTRYHDSRPDLHAAGFSLMEVPHVRYSGKNSADIRMAVDAIDVCHTKSHIDLFAVVSGDSDFSPLVAKLRENGKAVIGFGVRASTSQLLVEGCDEFIFYDDLVYDERQHRDDDDPLVLVANTAESLLRDRGESVFGSHVKQVLKRKRPHFRESHYGYGSFSDVLLAAQRENLLKIQKDKPSGGYIIWAANDARV